VRPGYRNFYLYAAVDPFHGESYIVELPWVNAGMSALFLQHLAAAFPSRRVLLFWDRAGFHMAKTIPIPANVTIVPLPPYSPELNPTERLWRWLRRHACRNRSFDSLDDLVEVLEKKITDLTNEQIARLCRCDYLMQIN
jgi:transposase